MADRTIEDLTRRIETLEGGLRGFHFICDTIARYAIPKDDLPVLCDNLLKSALDVPSDIRQERRPSLGANFAIDGMQEAIRGFAERLASHAEPS